MARRGFSTLEIENFKSFREANIDLSSLNVVIGPNAAGKSNLLDIIRFIRDLVQYDLRNAISLQGGINHFRNVKIGADRDFRLSFTLVDPYGFTESAEDGTSYHIKADETHYELGLEFLDSEDDYRRSRDALQISYNIFPSNRGELWSEDLGDPIGNVQLELAGTEAIPEIGLEMEGEIPLSSEVFEPSQLQTIEESQARRYETVLRLGANWVATPLDHILGEISVYDFNPRLPKKAVPVQGRITLEEDGSNLALVLQDILDDEEQKRKLFNLITDLLPFIDNLGIERIADTSLLVEVEETYYEEEAFPASSISDGTINTAALLIALYFEHRHITAIEEPAKNIHPGLISRIMAMMEDASSNKQLIITSHSPEVVKSAGSDSLMFVSRNDEGFSYIINPNERDEFEDLITEDFGLEDLFIENLLGS